MKKLKSKILAVSALLAMLLPASLPIAVYAACDAPASAAEAATCGVNETGTPGKTDIPGAIHNIVNVLSWLVGVLAVIMVIVGGFRYVTSGGDSSKVASARNTIVYAIVGLVIVALAQAIVHFVLDKAT